LLAEGVQLETFGGDIPAVCVSGLTGQGLPELVETISAVAEMQDLRAEQKGPIQGYVLESKIDKGLGYARAIAYYDCGSHTTTIAPSPQSSYLAAP
jgi:translation initiation factor IF-2